MTAKENALSQIAKQIRDLDKRTLDLAVLDCQKELTTARDALFAILDKNGFVLNHEYKLIAKK